MSRRSFSAGVLARLIAGSSLPRSRPVRRARSLPPCTLRAPDILDPTTPACCDHSDVRMPWRPLPSIWPIISAAVPFAYSREGADASLCGHLNMRPHCFAAARIRGCCSTRNDTSPLARSQSLFGGTHRTAPRPTSAAYPAPARISCSEKVRTCGSRWYESWSPP